MSSMLEDSERVSQPPPRPPTPGPIFNNAGELLDRRSSHGYDSSFSSRRSSIDLATCPKGQGVWIELDRTPSAFDEYEDTRQLLGKARPRVSSTASTSSNFSILDQGPIQRCIGACGAQFTSLASLPLVQKCLSPFRRIDHIIALSKSKSRFHGWRMGVLIGAYMSAIILCFNIIVVIIVAAKGGGFKGDSAELPFFYDTLTMSRLSSGIHILINALSTILLAASNYTMQVLTSPTREDLDSAHAAGQWFDIGVLSTHNLKRIPKRRLALCMVMGLSSIPLHLFYNSAAIYIAADNQYNVYLLNHTSTDWQDLSINESYQAFTNGKWQGAYESGFVGYGDLYLAFDETASTITNNLTGYPSVREDISPEANITWPLETNTSVSSLTSSILSSDWIEFQFPSTDGSAPKYAHIVYGLARIVPSRSRIQLSLRFMMVVIISNSIKLVLMLWVLLFEKSDFVVTLGDGAATYLERPDPTTEKFCVFSKESIISNVGRQHNKGREGDMLEELLLDANGTWRKQYHVYSSSLDRDREIGSYFIFIVIGLSFLLCITLAVSRVVSGQWGTTSETLLGGGGNASQNTLLIAWLANAPQLILSFCYLAINSECTSMAGAHEWNGLGISRKGLRVTKPLHHQRSTYFLQLPYKFSLPLTVISGGLHWLLSQSIFLVRTDYVKRDGNIDPTSSKSGCGISGLSIIILCIVFYILVVGVGLIGRRRLRVRIPFAASCSLVVSAACHPPADDQDAHLRPVQWGVVEQRMFDGELHCTLSSQPVKKAKPGMRYR